MTQEYLFQVDPRHRLEQLSRDELIAFLEAAQKVIQTQDRIIREQAAAAEELKQRSMFVGDQYIVLKNKLFGKSSEKEPTQPSPEEEEGAPAGGDHPAGQKKTKVQLPSLRYPNAPLIEREVELQELPECDCCGGKMEDSGMTEDSEFLTLIPAKFIVVRQKRHKYRCGGCHGCIKTAPSPPRVIPGSAYSDEMIQDVALSKYCDLIPIGRYVAIAGRAGVKDLPPQSLIETTHSLADFVDGAYTKLRKEILAAKVLHADETPHRMLEGDEKSSWSLWGFSSPTSAYFEARNTRSGDVAWDLLKVSVCEHLVSDVYSGYAKAVRLTNEFRAPRGLPLLRNIYCNAHARRYFKRALDSFPEEARYFVEQYKKIYQIETKLREKPPDTPAEKLKLRAEMKPYFESMRSRALEIVAAYPSKSAMTKALSYFLENYEELTAFTDMIELPIDNNPQERLLRSPVIGRKTWYGTHSKRGALTMAILFSLVESCKLNGVNPRAYFRRLVADLHSGKTAYTPHEFKQAAQDVSA